MANKNLTREDAAELYKDVRQAMATVKGKSKKAPGIVVPKAEPVTDEMKEVAKKIAQSISQSMTKDASQDLKKRAPAMKSFVQEETADAITRMKLESEIAPRLSAHNAPKRGQIAAVMAVLLFAGFKVVLGIVESAGLVAPTEARASYAPALRQSASLAQAATAQGYTKDEIHILTQLDQRRAVLEERGTKLQDQELEFAQRDREFAAKLNELRELTAQLKGERVHSEKKRNTQLDQLANVYGSMAPQEAATLMEQLDVTIAFDLLSRMPEKRIGQILALMHPERALALTKMLSGRG
jgi:flagellar motility protein MotE (MotC chaperone)